MFDYVDEKWNLLEEDIINDLKAGKISLMKEEREDEEGKKWIAIMIWPAMENSEDSEKPMPEEESLGLTELK